MYHDLLPFSICSIISIFYTDLWGFRIVANIDIIITAQNKASRELLKLRGNMQSINKTLAEQRSAMSKLTETEDTLRFRANLHQRNKAFAEQLSAYSKLAAVQRRNMESRRHALNAELLQNRADEKTLLIKKALLAEKHREILLTESMERQQARLSQGVEQTEHAYRALLHVSRRFVHIDFSTLENAFTRIRASGSSVTETIDILQGLLRMLGHLQVSASDSRRFFSSLTKSYAANNLELEAFKMLQESVPNMLRVSSRALDTEIDSFKRLKAVLDESNKSARDYYKMLAGVSLQKTDKRQLTRPSVEKVDVDPEVSVGTVETVAKIEFDIAEADRRLLQTGAARRQALVGSDIDAITQSTAADILALEQRAALRQRLLVKKSKESGFGVTDKQRLETAAEAIRIDNQLASERVRIIERSAARITAIENQRRTAENRAAATAAKAQAAQIKSAQRAAEAAAKEREARRKAAAKAEADALEQQRVSTEAFHKRVVSEIKETADAEVAAQRRVTEQYELQLKQRREAQMRAIAARVATAENAIHVNNKALQTARELARLDVDVRRDPRGRGGFSVGAGIQERTPATGSAELFDKAYQEYQRAYQQLTNQVGRDFEDRIGQALPAFHQRIQEQMQAGSQIVQAKFQQDAAVWEQYQGRVYREMTRSARQWSRILTNLVGHVAFNREQHIKEALTAFLQASVKRILQDTIETQLLIANQKRYQKELAKTAALAASRSNTSIVSAAVSGLAGGNPMIAALSAILPEVLSVSLRIGENQAVQIGDLQRKAMGRRSPR